MTNTRASNHPTGNIAIGTILREGTALVRTISKVWHVAGGAAVDVERVEDNRAPSMILTDGTLHPAARAGFTWTACLCNLTYVDEI